MADHTQTITNAMNILGVSAGNQWNVLVWGTDEWGASEDLGTGVGKWLTETMGLDDAVGKDFVKAPLTESITFTDSIDSVLREWGIWDYIATKPDTDWTERVDDESSKVGDPSSTYAAVSVPDTTWTGV
jgi:hypothetical protein